MGLPRSGRDALKGYAFLGIVVILAALLMSCGGPEPTPASVVGATSDAPTSPSPTSAAVAAGAAEQAAAGGPTPTAPQATGTTAPETVAAPTPMPTPVPAPLPTSMPAAQPGPSPSPATQPMPTAAPAKQPTPTPLPPPTVTPTPTAVPPPQLTGRVDLEAVRLLSAKRGVPLDSGLERVSIHSLDGVVLASQTELGPDATFSFVASRKNAYLIMAETLGGLKLWAISPLVLKDTVQIVNLRSTYVRWTPSVGQSWG